MPRWEGPGTGLLANDNRLDVCNKRSAAAEKCLDGELHQGRGDNQRQDIPTNNPHSAMRVTDRVQQHRYIPTHSTPKSKRKEVEKPVEPEIVRQMIDKQK